VENIVGKIGWFFTYVSLLDGYDIKSFARLVDCRQNILLRQLFQICIFEGAFLSGLPNGFHGNDAFYL
jgi:hypothetical protein